MQAMVYGQPLQIVKATIFESNVLAIIKVLLAKTRDKTGKGAGEPYASELTPEKEAAIREAFIWFGLIKNE